MWIFCLLMFCVFLNECDVVLLACLSRILREMLLETTRVKPIGAIVEFASVEKMKEVRKLRRCYRAKVVARSTIGTA